MPNAKRIKLTGSRREEGKTTRVLGAAEQTICASSLGGLPAKPNPLYLLLSFRQDLNQFCALNAVYNALLVQSLPLPQSTYDDIYSRGALFPLEAVVGLLHDTICRFAKPKGINNSGLLTWLRTQTQGVYVCEYSGRLAGHCVTYDAATGRVIETDPTAGAESLGLVGLEKVYRVNVFHSKKRKRTSAV